MKTRLQNCPNIINIFQMLSGGSNESDPGMVSFARWVVGELVGKLVGELRRAMSGTVVSTLEQEQCMHVYCAKQKWLVAKNK